VAHVLSTRFIANVCLYICVSVGLLPLCGIIPDVTSDSNKYIQSVYLSVYMSLCMSVCLSLGLLPLRGIILDMTSYCDKYIQSVCLSVNYSHYMEKFRT